EEKLRDLEKKTELQSLKHEEILLEFESLKAKRDRILPHMYNNNNHNSTAVYPLISPTNPSIQHQLKSITHVSSQDSQTSPSDDSAPQFPTTKKITVLHRSTGSQSNETEVELNLNNELKQRHQVKNFNQIPNNQSAIVIAKYSYDPIKFSPNDHPETELPLTMGEYYLIFGNIDEDGFFDGRNLEGRYGLIPSNFIELVNNLDELPETVRNNIKKLTGKNLDLLHNRDAVSSIDSDVFIPSSSSHNKILVSNKSQSYENDQITNPIHNGSISETSNNHSEKSNKNVYSRHIPCPTNLKIEKQLSNSIMIAWSPPIMMNNQQLQLMGYQVLLDHNLYLTIHPNEKTRALIENINLNELHRISVRTVTQRGLSRDQECTLLINGNSTTNTNSEQILFYAPSELRVDRISQTSAVVSWWPASNDLAHKLLVNDIEVQTLKANVHRFKLSGLLPNTIHKVTIRAKIPSHHSKQTQQQQQLSASIEFKTLPFDESVESPKRVQIIGGPQSNTLLVSWIPSTSLSNTSIRGYRILIDGRKLVDVLNPSSDHTVLHTNSLNHARLLTVRCLTEEGESRDSIPISLVDALTKLDMDTPLTSTTKDDNDNEGVQKTSSLTLRSDDEYNTVNEYDDVNKSNIPGPVAMASNRSVDSNSFIENTRLSASVPHSFDISPINQRQSASIKMDENGIPSSFNNSKPDKIRPIMKEKVSRTPSSPSSTQPKLNDVPQIEINSPSPSSPRKSREEERFGYDEYIQQAPIEDIPSPTRISKLSSKHQPHQQQPRKVKENRSASSSNSTGSSRQTLSQQQRDHSDPRNNPSSADNRRSEILENEHRRTTRNSPSSSTILSNTDRSLKYSSPRHASSSSDDQQTFKLTPSSTRAAHIKEENSEIINRKLPQQQQQQQQKPLSTFDKIKTSVDHRPRLFIALFTYDPNLMSPNKDNDEELPFNEGQLIKIYGDQDADGFYVGETSSGRTGYVPGNMVTELQVEDAEIEAQLLREQFGEINHHNQSNAPTSPLTANSQPMSKTYLKNSTSSPPVKKMIAVYDYNAHELSPNADPDEELSFKSGDIIYVHGNVLDDGYFMGEMNGVQGLVPSNFLQEVTNDSPS
ncbi:unnamed protein product, partial [Didymodactylos carnosus]